MNILRAAACCVNYWREEGLKEKKKRNAETGKRSF
jgi:hypothetical protein